MLAMVAEPSVDSAEMMFTLVLIGMSHGSASLVELG